MPGSLLARDLTTELEALEGLISEAVGLKLAELAALVPANHAIVEIGSFKGKSTAYLAAGALAGWCAPVFAFDAWDLGGNAGGRFGYNDPAIRMLFDLQLRNVGLREQVTACRIFSRDAAKDWTVAPIGLLYIDGSHAEKDVRADWECWSPFLAPAAVVVFDDYATLHNPGVTKVVEEVRKTFGKHWAFAPQPLAIGWAA